MQHMIAIAGVATMTVAASPAPASQLATPASSPATS
jgi:hypothetical protein